MAGVGRELANELALGTAVALAEGVDGVDFAEIEGGPPGEGFGGEVAEVGFGGELAEEVVEGGGDVLRGGEGRAAGLGEAYEAELAGPGKDVLKEVVMDAPEVSGVEVAGDAALKKLNRPAVGIHAFQLR